MMQLLMNIRLESNQNCIKTDFRIYPTANWISFPNLSLSLSGRQHTWYRYLSYLAKTLDTRQKGMVWQGFTTRGFHTLLDQTTPLGVYKIVSGPSISTLNPVNPKGVVW